MDNDVTTVTWRCHNSLTVRVAASCLSTVQNGSTVECEDIADASLSLDDARRARIDLKLAPQSQDLDIDAPIENILMHTRGLQ